MADWWRAVPAPLHPRRYASISTGWLDRRAKIGDLRRIRVTPRFPAGCLVKRTLALARRAAPMKAFAMLAMMMWELFSRERHLCSVCVWTSIDCSPTRPGPVRRLKMKFVLDPRKPLVNVELSVSMRTDGSLKSQPGG
jgi:hypothetical protein